MFRLLATLGMGMAVGYCAFFVRLDGKTLFGHAHDVWMSPVMQQKVELVGREVPRALGLGAGGKGPTASKGPPSARPPSARAPIAAPAPAPSRSKKGEHHTQQDRDGLEALVQRVHREQEIKK